MVSERNIETGEKRPVSGLKVPIKKNEQGEWNWGSKQAAKAEGQDPAEPSLTFDFLVSEEEPQSGLMSEGTTKMLGKLQKT